MTARLSNLGRRLRGIPTKWRWIGGILVVVIALAYTTAYLTDEPLRRYVERQVNGRLTGYHVTIQRLSVHPHSLSFDLENTTIIQNAHPEKPIADLYRLN
ncbi:MAG TPA: hypothetical protein VFN71_14460, partial [Methylomirabilota bacterium]|nr:hypothetical protein [Methylomirabilota bacterium]